MKFYVFNLPGAMEQVAQFRPYCRIQKEILRSGLDNNVFKNCLNGEELDFKVKEIGKLADFLEG